MALFEKTGESLMSAQIKSEEHSLTNWEKIKKVVDAFLSAWFYILVGIVIGFTGLIIERVLNFVVGNRLLDKAEGFLVEHQWLNDSSGKWLVVGLTVCFEIIGFISEHLGIGFIVAALAVLFYEWGAHLKETVELNKRLIGSLAEAKVIIKSLNLTEILYTRIETNTTRGLKKCLDTLIIGPTCPKDSQHLQDASSKCENLILAISSLREPARWCNKQYIEFLTKHIDEVVGHNARALSSLRSGPRDFHVPPTAARMADEVLAKQMEAMEEGDRYDVISDISSWQPPQLGTFFEKTEAAVTQRNVKVRRVLNFLPYARGSRSRSLPLKCEEILKRHLEASENWKGRTAEASYELKILWPKGLETLLEDARVNQLTNMETLHFGLFIHRNECVKFSVTEIDLSDMELRWQEWNEDHKDGVTFKAVWDASIPFPPGTTIEEKVSKVIDELREKAR
jgi:hypothetical protein